MLQPMKTVLIPEDLLAKVKILAALEKPKKTIQDITAEKLQEYVGEASVRMADKLPWNKK
ncbi:MAG TPA: hypothetical protein DDW65_21550 [Firmicutes bacterium]|jgi:hypothetical protein|nr:hypothetical protein [Bacillota bacterium]